MGQAHWWEREVLGKAMVKLKSRRSISVGAVEFGRQEKEPETVMTISSLLSIFGPRLLDYVLLMIYLV